MNELTRPATPRRSYRKPTLTEHGTLSQLTRSFGNKGAADGGTNNGMDKTGM